MAFDYCVDIVKVILSQTKNHKHEQIKLYFLDLGSFEIETFKMKCSNYLLKMKYQKLYFARVQRSNFNG